MLFKILKKSFFPSLIMWMDGDGGSDLGTAGLGTESTTVELTTETTQVEPVVETPTVSVAEVQRLRDENERLKEYAEFIKQAPPAVEQVYQKPEIDPKEVTYAEDVDKIVDYKINMFMKLEEQKNLERDLRVLADENRAKDPQFESRMELALEFMERDPVSQGQFDRAKTAKDKIAVLEKCAKWNPRYDLLQKPVSTPVNDIVDRLKQNAELPATINTMQTAGKTQKAVSEMDEIEYSEFFKNVTKGY